MPSSIPLPVLKPVLLDLATRLTGHRYAFRGTTSLVLQGLDMGITDIDILCDQATAQFLLPTIKYSESPRFKSFFGSLPGYSVPVEVMGDWQIKNSKGQWSQVFSATDHERTQILLDHQPVWVTTIQTELTMFALMSRWSAYHKIKRQL